jgi:hypothetical protein
MDWTPDEKIILAQYSNIKKKVKDGKTLTATDRSTLYEGMELQERAANGDAVPKKSGGRPKNEVTLKREKLEHECAILRMEREQKERTHAPIDLLKRKLTQVLTPIKSQIIALPKKAHLCNPNDYLQAEGVLKEEVKLILQSIEKAFEMGVDVDEIGDRRGGNNG